MAIREQEIDGKITYNVSINIRSKVKADLRVQMLRRRIPTLKEAKLVERELIRDTAIEMARREGIGMSWGEVVEKWELLNRQVSIVNKRIQRDTLWTITAGIHRFTKEWMGKVCNEISAGDVRKVFRSMETQGYSKSRLRAVRSSINVVFKFGIEEGFITGIQGAPTNGVEIGKDIQEKPPQILSLNEIHHLLSSAKQLDHEWYPVWAMALNTGMRSGELYALQWEDVDFANKLITVSKSYNKRLDTIKSTKAGYWRKVPINSELETVLLELWNKGQKKEGKFHVLPRINRWRRGESARHLKEFCEGIGISNVCFHALRACFATHMLNAGVSSPVVKKICGWTDEKVMGRYIRLAGIDVSGATANLGFINPVQREKRVVNMHEYQPYRRRDKV
ncbi:MAG: site-specific integrase [Bdellovibrionaceae bacterium]|nr:site-specific integrase [Pseudobdellovibrionaceae bacterium]